MDVIFIYFAMYVFKLWKSILQLENLPFYFVKPEVFFELIIVPFGWFEKNKKCFK